ncbi:MAG: hypothetical protein JNM84_01875 [Planctomycetes bacterium]|nr:hypothetical protein [Planctomycetota bacterium]
MIRLHSLLGAITATAALLSFAAPAEAQKKIELDKAQKIKDWGYEIRTLKGWNSMPADQEERFTVGRWKFDVSELRKRGDYEAMQAGELSELKVIRIARETETGEKPPKTEEEEAKEKTREVILPKSLLKRQNIKSFEDWIEAEYEGASKRWTRENFKGAKMPGELIEFGSGVHALTIGYFQKDGVDWAVVYSAFEEINRKTWREWYVKSLQTFEVTAKVDPAAAAAAKKDVTQLVGAEKREALKQSIAGNPGWYAIDTTYYVFLSNATNKQFVSNLAKDMETMREKAYIPLFRPRNQDIPLSPVRVFNTQAEYHQYGGPRGSAGYFRPDRGELVLFVQFEGESKSESKDNCRSVMFHEGFHQYVHFSVGDVSPHSWFNEGHGDYFAGAFVTGGGWKVKPFDWRVQLLKAHLAEKRDLIACKTLVRMPQSEYYSNAGLKYAQGWALVYYLREVSKKKEHQKILDNYFNYLADNVAAFRAKQKEKKEGEEDDDLGGESIPGIPGIRFVNFEDSEKVEQILSEAVDKAFEGVDFEELDKGLRAWLEKI